MPGCIIDPILGHLPREYEDNTMSILAALKTGFSDSASSSGSDSEQGDIQSVDLGEEEVIASDEEDRDDSSS